MAEHFVALTTDAVGVALLRRHPRMTVQYVLVLGQDRTPPAPTTTSTHPEPVLPLLLTFAQASEVIGYSERHVRRLVADGRLPAVKDGRRHRIRRADAERFVEELLVEAGPGAA